MSFYRSLLVATVAAAFIIPVFADDTVEKAKSSSDIIQISESDGQTKATILSEQTSHPSEQIAPVEQTKINLNKADAKELAKVKGLNTSKARAIVAYRKKHGDFKSLDDLAKVRGFKRMNVEKLKTVQDQLTLEG
ncbi:MAG TPA: helix-hairpin-helix domain-containing protein [Gammaproteobacteria bacterium]|nr:helix-hairpin-helix domain-containing protein [Gammaproteobacteria bacterium]